MAYVCFIVDAFSRRIVGWRVASNMKTDMVLDALEMARRSRGGRRLVGLVAHSDAGSQFTSVRFTERLDEIGARPSIGTVADSYDNALAETTNGLYKAECVFGPDAPRPWDDVDELELATLSWVHWFNEHPPPQPLRRRAASRVRSSVLRCPTDRPRRGWKPIARASIRPRAVQQLSLTELRRVVRRFRYGQCSDRRQVDRVELPKRAVQAGHRRRHSPDVGFLTDVGRLSDNKRIDDGEPGAQFDNDAEVRRERTDDRVVNLSKRRRHLDTSPVGLIDEAAVAQFHHDPVATARCLEDPGLVATM
jgi:hypothetical protein